MMNNIFQDLINQEDIATFIDNILVATDTKEEYNVIFRKYDNYVISFP